MTKKYALFICLSLTLLAAGDASGVSKDLPDDFRIVAVAGGVGPSTSVFKIEIDPKGHAVYSTIAPADRRTGTVRVIDRFDIPVSRLEYIYKRIKDNKFMSLKSEYVDKTVTDGSFASLTITADKKTRTVRTQNISVKAFDTVMIALNLSLPKDRRIIYNEISY